MAKIVAQNLGVPAPAGVDTTLSLIGYYGSVGFTPSYSQTQRANLGAVSALKATVRGTTNYWDAPIASILGTAPSGSTSFVFTLMDAAGNESDFSPAVNVLVPPTLGQPVVL